MVMTTIVTADDGDALWCGHKAESGGILPIIYLGREAIESML